MKTYFIVSDVHSFYYQMEKALVDKGFEFNNKNHILIVCGDAFDRGPDTKILLHFLQEMHLQNRLIYIRGNHEDLLFSCIREIFGGHTPSHHHFSNGTMDTIAQLCDYSHSGYLSVITDSKKWDVYDNVKPLMDFINEVCIDYLETPHHIFVHGWVPCSALDTNVYHARKKFDTVDPIWNQPEDPLYDGAWKAARWINGMEAWHQGCKIEGKTIVCGHWHCSWGWSHLRRERKEFPQKNWKNWTQAFEPFADEGILAIDAATSYSGIVNCIMLKEEDL